MTGGNESYHLSQHRHQTRLLSIPHPQEGHGDQRITLDTQGGWQRAAAMADVHRCGARLATIFDRDFIVRQAGPMTGLPPPDDRDGCLVITLSRLAIGID